MLNDFDNYNSLIRRNVHSVIILPTRGEYKGGLYAYRISDRTNKKLKGCKEGIPKGRKTCLIRGSELFINEQTDIK